MTVEKGYRMDTRSDMKPDEEYKGNSTNQTPEAIPPESLVGQDDCQQHAPGTWTKLRNRAEETVESVLADVDKVKDKINNSYE